MSALPPKADNTIGDLLTPPNAWMVGHSFRRRRYYCIESLPVPSVKIFWLQRREVNIIDAARVDIDLVRIRAWHIERMDAAVPAERVLGHASVKRVGH